VNEEGEFHFDFVPAEKGFYRVTLSDELNLILPLGKEDEIKVEGDAYNSYSLEVSGSADVERMAELNKTLRKSFEEQEALNQEFQQLGANANRDSLIEVFRGRFDEMENAKIEALREMIDENPSSFTNLAIVEQLPGESAEDLEYYRKVVKGLENEYGQSPFYTSFKSKVDAASQFAPGSKVPEINLPNPEGNLVPLSSLRGQVVLIDFWASWCKPCRMENPNVVAAYQKYKDKGFTVYGVSLDRTKEAWVNAIEADNLNWTHVSDLKFWQSEAAQDYGVRGIPFAVLIDEEGKVIGKNLRGAELHRTLEEVLN
jgi:peroxiredoxin